MPRDILRDLAPGEIRKIGGQVVLFDWERHLDGSAACEIVQRDDGSAYVELLRYAKVTRGFTDARRVPIEGGTFLALADALFAPVESDARIDAVRKAALDSGRYGTCPKCRGEGWAKCRLCHGKGIAPVDRIADHERDSAASARKAVEVPWDQVAAESVASDDVTLPSLWLDVRAVIDGDGDAPALANVAAIPKPSGPVKLAVVPMEGGGPEVQTLTMPRETYLAFAAALMMCVGASSADDGSIEPAD